MLDNGFSPLDKTLVSPFAADVLVDFLHKYDSLENKYDLLESEHIFMIDSVIIDLLRYYKGIKPDSINYDEIIYNLKEPNRYDFLIRSLNDDNTKLNFILREAILNYNRS
ncbi:hypothetical protein [Spirosoma radiotolerans]|uniref:Uncharacterized protein n=1 Tax=Spirosoma radiotolerans TaxID=1379870 RepID=A0A0E3V517_9BACT|nr:hypothetical protein [Spirosoma radiotolerans]AKD53797.1 hypothetical protein SD10_01650 [Spirosoma radiotolerans]